LVINACPVVIGRDFNVRFQLAADPDSRRLSDVLSRDVCKSLVSSRK